MKYVPLNFQEKLSKFSDHWSPRIIAQMNDCHFKLAKIKGDFIWHRHDNTDEAFIILSGQMSIELIDGKIDLNTGEMFVVPKGTDHKPMAENECMILLIEQHGTFNTGNSGGSKTIVNDIWI